eukprot:CAMPEP_0117420266 /NCGR_PEP_ID=MMETSP0758-20121206/1632_1 /TAXON_ID=63605 /ORGANISM="Percolomonas cosmopolitus, Strain AE-1 (ATCC 50343)" /LENGTH=188 /DNA_ID=CAMNT_0005201767 /DNA_START=358 /DNA_END=921 /DNA_ORIENTATION=-
MTHIIPRWFRPKYYGIVTGIVTSSYDTIEMITMLLYGGLIMQWNPSFGVWKVLMIATICFMGLILFINLFFLRSNPPPFLRPSASLDDLTEEAEVMTDNSVQNTDDLFEAKANALTEKTEGFMHRDHPPREHDMDARPLRYVFYKMGTSFQFWAMMIAVAGLVIIQESIHHNRRILLELSFEEDHVLW